MVQLFDLKARKISRIFNKKEQSKDLESENQFNWKSVPCHPHLSPMIICLAGISIEEGSKPSLEENDK